VSNEDELEEEGKAAGVFTRQGDPRMMLWKTGWIDAGDAVGH
jgi:hypothetical protein